MTRLFTFLTVALVMALPWPGLADDMQRGVAIGTEIVVRNAPQVEGRLVQSLTEGDALFVFEQSPERTWLGPEKDFWYRVETVAGNVGWLHASQLLRHDLEAQAKGSGVRMRTEPNTSGTYITHLGTGAWVKVVDRSETQDTIGGATAYWYKVRTATAEGWVFGTLLEFALETPSSASAPFLGWRCWPGRADARHPTAEQILAGVVRWREVVAADITTKLSQAGSDADATATAQLATAWQALADNNPQGAKEVLAPVLTLDQDVVSPLGSAQATASVFLAHAEAASGAGEESVKTAVEAALQRGTGLTLTGANWTAEADLAAFDVGLHYLEQERKATRTAREWVQEIASNSSYSPLVRAAAGYHAARLHFAARDEAPAMRAVNAVLVLGQEAQVACGSAPVHFGAAALVLASKELAAVGGAADAITLCESVLRMPEPDPGLQGAARVQIAQLADLGTGDTETVLAAYQGIPDFAVRLADLSTLDPGSSAARVAALRGQRERIGGSDQAWVIGDRVRLRAAPSSTGAVLRAMSRDTTVRLLYRLPPELATDETPWIKVRASGGSVGWMSTEYLEVIPPRLAGLPTAQGLLWSQAGAGPRGGSLASGAEIDDPVVMWRVPNGDGGVHALGDITEDGIADLIVSHRSASADCRGSVALIDGRTQNEVWRAQTAACPTNDGVAVGRRVVVVRSGTSSLQGFDARSGAALWSWQADQNQLTAPVLYGNSVAVGSSAGVVHLLNLQTGERKGRVRMAEPVHVKPSVQTGVMYLITDTYLTAFDLNAERPRWRARLANVRRRGTTAQQSSGGVTIADDYVIAASRNGSVIVSRIANGDPLWQQSADGLPIGGPLYDGERVIVALQGGGIKAWNVRSGTPEWQTSLPTQTTGAPLLVDHTIVLGSADGTVSGISRVDGRSRWQIDVGTAADSPIVGGGGRIVAGLSANGSFVVLADARVATMQKAAP